MKIRITVPLPVEKAARPEVGSIYEVVDYRPEEPFMAGFVSQDMYFIKVGLAQVGVRANECEVVEG